MIKNGEVVITTHFETNFQREENLAKGLACLKTRHFFDAHEYWEIPWKEMRGDVRSFWQAMIQLSVGAYHFENNNLTGCRNLWNKALKRCDALLSERNNKNSWEIHQLREILQIVLQEIEQNGEPLAQIQHFATTIVTPDWFDFR